MNKKILVLVMIIALLFSGCLGVSLRDDKQSVNDDHSELSKQIIIYQISRDALNCFLQKPSGEYLRDNNITSTVYDNEGYYTTNSNTRFPINKELIDFLGNKEQVKKYLSENGVTNQADSIAMIDAPNMPVSVWVKTESENCYITINEELSDKIYTYRFYNEKDYVKKYTPKNGKLIMNGKEIACKNVPKVYYNYADVPLLCVLKEFGADVERQENIIHININERKYELNTDKYTLYVEKMPDENLFNIWGGSQFIYLESDEIMVDDATLSSILHHMVGNTQITVNSENGTVTITKVLTQ